MLGGGQPPQFGSNMLLATRYRSFPVLTKFANAKKVSTYLNSLRYRILIPLGQATVIDSLSLLFSDPQNFGGGQSLLSRPPNHGVLHYILMQSSGNESIHFCLPPASRRDTISLFGLSSGDRPVAGNVQLELNQASS